ncbi:MAG: cell wall anchor protein [Anaerolineae bacterium]|nr:cell wall anchor protein [Anaerolineae bacterium]
MSRAFVASWLVLALLTTFTLPAWAGDPVEAGLGYLAAQQQPDGGFGSGFGEGSDLGTTCDIVLAIAAGGQDVSTWVSEDGNSPLDYLYTRVAGGVVDTPGLKAKVILALLAAGQHPTAFAGHDLVAELNAAYDETSGSYGGTIFDQALAMLALFIAGQPVPDGAAQYLLDNQRTDGAWALFGGTTAGTGDTNTTALAVQALIVTGHRDEIGDAFAYFRRVQNDDGGFPYQNPSDYGTDTDANSTAVVLQALLAAGEPLGNWTPGGTDPLGALVALHDPSSGAFFWQAAAPYPNVLATAQAIPAIAGYAFVHLPRVGVANAPEPVAAPVLDVILLPESGGLALLPVGLTGLGIIALGAGLALRRRWREGAGK